MRRVVGSEERSFTAFRMTARKAESGKAEGGKGERQKAEGRNRRSEKKRKDGDVESPLQKEKMLRRSEERFLGAKVAPREEVLAPKTPLEMTGRRRWRREVAATKEGTERRRGKLAATRRNDGEAGLDWEAELEEAIGRLCRKWQRRVRVGVRG